MTRTITLRSGYTISYEGTVFDIANRNLTLILKSNSENIRLENDIQHNNLIDSEEVVFDMQECEFSAKLKFWTGLNMNIGNDYRNSVSFYVSDIEKKNFSVQAGQRLLFYIPDASIDQMSWAKNCYGGGALDYTTVNMFGRKIVLRNSYGKRLIGHQGVPIELLEPGDGRSEGIYLEIVVKNGDSLKDISQTVSKISNLLSLQQGKQVYWESVWLIDNKKMQLLAVSDYLYKENTSDSSIVFLQNDSCKLNNPIEFIEKTEGNYLLDYEWWRISILWYLNGRKSHAIEVEKLIDGMLLDRMTNKVFSLIVKIALNEDLSDYKGRTQDIIKSIGADFKTKIANGKSKPNLQLEDEAFLKMCEQWINKPGYMGRIKFLFEFAGLSLQSFEEDEIEYRHSLAHNGEIKNLAGTQNVMEYDSRMSKFCLLLLLGMLGYNDWFRVRLYEVKVDQEMPFADRIQLRRIECFARKLLAN